MKRLFLLLLAPCSLLLAPCSLLLAPLKAQTEAHITRFSEADHLYQTKFACAIQDRQGYVWISTWDGLCRYDGYRFITYKTHPGDNSPLTSNRFGYIKELPDGNIYCYTENRQFYIFNRKDNTFTKTTGSIAETHNYYHPSQDVIQTIAAVPQFQNIWFRVLLVDRQHGYWVYTRQGLFRVHFDKAPLTPRKIGSGEEEQVCGLYHDSKQRVWIADKNGFVRLENTEGRIIGYITPQGRISTSAVPFGASVYTVFEDHRGTFWLGAKPDGLFQLTPDGDAFHVKHFTHDASDPYSLSCDNIYSIAEDRQHRLWIGTYQGGLNMLSLDAQASAPYRFINSRNLLRHHPKDELANCIHKLLITPENILLIATNNGLYTCSLKEPLDKMLFHCNQRRPDKAASLSCNQVMDIIATGDGDLMVATNGGGVSRILSTDLLTDNIEFQHYMSDKGLPSDICIAMVREKDNSLFIVSEAAMSHFQPANGSFTNYMRGTFSSDFTFTEADPVILPDGRHLLATTRGVLDFKAEDLQRSTFVPPLVLDCPATINLDASDPNVTIEFSALDYNRNVPITYAYRFADSDSSWIYTKDHSITLHNLPAGTYELHIRSTNGDGVWVDNEQVVTIYRPARFHETPYSWMLYGILLALLLWAVYNVVAYIRRLENEIKDIRLTSNERIQILTEQIKAQLSIGETVEKVEETANIEDEEDRRFADKVKQLVTDNLSNSDFSVNDFAREMAMSRTVLYARIRSVFGTTPNNYIFNIRIEEAKRQLRLSTAHIAEVAYRCGFSDPKYFSRCFKKIVGVSPSEYHPEQI